MKLIRVGNKEGHYSAGVISNGMLYISGQLPVDLETGEIIEGGIERQTKIVLENIERVLNAAGLDKSDVVNIKVYIPDISYWGIVDKIYGDFFGTHKPSRTVVPTTKLHLNASVIMDCIAEYENLQGLGE